MRILFLSTWFPYPPDNGSKIRVYHLLRALSQRHHVTLLSFAWDTAQPDDGDGYEPCCEEAKVVRRNPFKRSRVAWALRFFSVSPVAGAPIAEMQELVSETLVRTRFDVVIASTTMMAVYALMAEHVPRILEEHNCWSQWSFETYRRQTNAWGRLRRWASWRKRLRYESRLYRQFDLCTMVSEPDRAAALRVLPRDHGRVEVVPNGVDCRRHPIGLAQPRANTLVFNGALTYGANYDAMRWFLGEVWPFVWMEVPEVTLTITGSTSGVDLAGLPLDGRVHFSGYVADVRPLVAGAWVCVVPIWQGSGTRLKILEAMALGTPVVATSKGAEGLSVSRGRNIVIADEPADFAADVVRLLGDPALRDHLARNGRRLVEERYDWEKIGKGFVRLVETVAGS